MAEIVLVNSSQISSKSISNLLQKVVLPKGKIILLLTEEAGTGNFGECVPKCLLDFAHRQSFFREYINDDWGSGVIIYPKAYEIYEEYPAYFTYLLGHELGHAHVCLTDIHLHIHYCLIQEYIELASSGEIKEWHELPHEILFDQYGLYISEMMFTKEQFYQEIAEITKLPEFINDQIRLNKLLNLRPTNDISGLRKNLIKFSLPYKDKLITLWKQDTVKTLAGNDLSITQLIRDHELLFI